MDGLIGLTDTPSNEDASEGLNRFSIQAIKTGVINGLSNRLMVKASKNVAYAI